MFDELARTGPSVHSGEHARIRGRVHNPIAGRKPIDIAGGPSVGVENADSEPLEPFPVRFAARPDEIVETEDLMPGSGLRQGAGDRASREAANPGNQDFQLSGCLGVTLDFRRMASS